MKYAIATGDIVGSSRLKREDRAKVAKVLKRGYEELKSSYQSSLTTEIDVFRGDSWQMRIDNPENAARICLTYRAYLLYQESITGLDTRISIGIGDIDVFRAKVSEGNGEAYRLSGYGLDTMRKSERLKIVFPTELQNSNVKSLADTIFSLIDVVVRDWTRKQAQAAYGALEGKKQEDIALSWIEGPISQQAIAKHLDKAGWESVNKGVNSISYLIHETV